MAEVWLARQTGTAGFHKLVVIKTLHPHLAESQELVDMFIREASIAVDLSHPNVVQILDLGFDEGRHYMVMEYIAGTNLRHLARKLRKNRDSLPLWALLNIATRICDGLQHIHDHHAPDGTELNLVHRDLTPDNIMLSFTGGVKIVDFGVMRIRGVDKTGMGKIVGKPHYMAPEQIMDESVDNRADIYSLGIILYQYLAGRRPFSGSQQASVMLSVMTDTPAPITEYNPGVNPKLASIVMRAMARRPTDRHQQAQDLSDELLMLMMELGLARNNRRMAMFVAACFQDSMQIPMQTRKLLEAAGITSPGGVPAPSLTTGEVEIEVDAEDLPSTQHLSNRELDHLILELDHTPSALHSSVELPSQHARKPKLPSVPPPPPTGTRAAAPSAPPVTVASPIGKLTAKSGAIESGEGAVESSAAGPRAPTVAKSSAAEPAVARSSAPSVAKPSVAKPSAAKPSVAKPSAAKPSAAKPSAAKPSAAKPSAAKPSAAKPSAGRPKLGRPKVEAEVTPPAREAKDSSVRIRTPVPAPPTAPKRDSGESEATKQDPGTGFTVFDRSTYDAPSKGRFDATLFSRRSVDSDSDSEGPRDPFGSRPSPPSVGSTTLFPTPRSEPPEPEPADPDRRSGAFDTPRAEPDRPSRAAPWGSGPVASSSFSAPQTSFGDLLVGPVRQPETKPADPPPRRRPDSSSPPSPGAALFDEGHALLMEGDLRRALLKWETACEEAPDNRTYSANLKRLRLMIAKAST